MKCSQHLFITVSLSVVVLIYLTTSAQCIKLKTVDGSYNSTLDIKKSGKSTLTKLKNVDGSYNSTLGKKPLGKHTIRKLKKEDRIPRHRGILGSHIIIVGKREPGDRLIFYERLMRPANTVTNKRTTRTRVYPPKKFISKYKITYCIIEDQGPEGYAYHVSGDVGMDSIGFYFLSQPGKELYFKNQIFGFKL